MYLHIQGATVIDPSRFWQKKTDVYIAEGKIQSIGERPVDWSDAEAQHIAGEGKILAPGFFDVHAHFRDPGFTYKEDIGTGARAALAGGYTSVVCMANTNPIIDRVERLQPVLEKMAKQPLSLYSAAAITQDFDGKTLTDFRALKQAGAVVFTDDGIPLQDPRLIRRAMEEAKSVGRMLSFHEEEPSLIDGLGVHAGKVAADLGYAGAPAISEALPIARDVLLALETGAKIDIQHISTKFGVEMVRWGKARGADLFCEATPHHFALTEEALRTKGTLARVNPPLRTEEDRQAIIEGLQDGTIDVIATDHAPHSVEEKERPMETAPSGMIGLELSMSLGLTYLVHAGKLSMMHWLRTMSTHAAQALTLPGGSLQEGDRADLVLFDPNTRVSYTRFQSKSSNTPFFDVPLYGRVCMTIAKGEIAYRWKGESDEY